MPSAVSVTPVSLPVGGEVPAVPDEAVVVAVVGGVQHRGGRRGGVGHRMVGQRPRAVVEARLRLRGLGGEPPVRSAWAGCTGAGPGTVPRQRHRPGPRSPSTGLPVPGHRTDPGRCPHGQRAGLRGVAGERQGRRRRLAAVRTR